MIGRIRKSIAAWLFSVPAFLFIGLFVAYPIVASLWMSLTDYHLLYSDDPAFGGLGNYRRVLNDRYFWIGLRNTLVYTAARVPVIIFLSMFLAALIQACKRFGRLCQTLLFVPVLVPEAMGAVVVVWMLSEKFGLVNHLLGMALGTTVTRNWLGEPRWAMAAIVLTSYWGIGTNIVLFSAGLAGIPKSLYEAAAVDGAGPWARFRAVTFPSLRHTPGVVSVLAIIGSLKVFALPYIMTQGGPGSSTMVLYYWVYKNAFEYYKLGYGCAMAYLLGLIVLVFAAGQLLLSRRESPS